MANTAPRHKNRAQQADRKGRALAQRAFHRDAAVRKLQNAPDQRKAQAVALRGMAGVALVEFIKDVPHCLRQHAASVVRHRYQNAVFLCPLGQRHRAALRGELDGIGKQIVQTTSIRPGSA